MKLSEAFARAHTLLAGGQYSVLHVSLVSTQDVPRAGNSDPHQLLAGWAGQTNTPQGGGRGSSPVLGYMPVGASATHADPMGKGPAFAGTFWYVQSDTVRTYGGHAGDSNPFNLQQARAIKLTITASSTAPQGYLFALRDGARVTQLQLQEVGDLWMGLGVPEGYDTPNVGWILAIGSLTLRPALPHQCIPFPISPPARMVA